MANDINSINIIGRLTRDCGSGEHDFGYTKGGTASATVSIAVNRSVKRNDEWQTEVSYFDVKIWGKSAENLKQYLTKGKQIGVSGFLKQDRWKDNEGNSKSKVYIVAENVELLGGNNGGNKDGNNTEGGSYAPESNSGNTDMGTDNGFPEEIPF